MADTSSWFHEQAQEQIVDVVRKFTIGNSDYSDYVKKWPTIKFKHDSVSPNNVNITLFNKDSSRTKDLNIFVDCKATLITSASLSIGFPGKGVAYEALGPYVGDGGNVSSSFATNVSISDSGDYAAISRTATSSVVNNGGGVEIWRRYETSPNKFSWVKNQAIYSPTSISLDFFGDAHNFGNDGNYLVVGHSNTTFAQAQAGAVSIYKRFSPYTKFRDPEKVVNGFFDSNISSWWVNCNPPGAVYSFYHDPTSNNFNIQTNSGQISEANVDQLISLDSGYWHCIRVNRNGFSITPRFEISSERGQSDIYNFNLSGATNAGSFYADTHSAWLRFNVFVGNSFDGWFDAVSVVSRKPLDKGLLTNPFFIPPLDFGDEWSLVSTLGSQIFANSYYYLRTEGSNNSNNGVAWTTSDAIIGHHYKISGYVEIDWGLGTSRPEEAKIRIIDGSHGLAVEKIVLGDGWFELDHTAESNVFRVELLSSIEANDWTRYSNVGVWDVTCGGFKSGTNLEHVANSTFKTSINSWFDVTTVVGGDGISQLENPSLPDEVSSGNYSAMAFDTLARAATYFATDSGNEYELNIVTHSGADISIGIGTASDSPYDIASFGVQDTLYFRSRVFTAQSSETWVTLDGADPSANSFHVYEVSVKPMYDKYVFVNTITTPTATLNGFFGKSVSFPMGASRLLIGAPGEVDAGSNAPGNAYTYTGCMFDDTWALHQTFNGTNSGDNFGNVVKYSGDRIRFAINAPFADVTTTLAGATYIFIESYNSVQASYDTLANDAGNSQAGFSRPFARISKTVATDYRGDHWAVGAPIADVSCQYVGRVDTYVKSGGGIYNLHQTFYGDASSEFFGSTVLMNNSASALLISKQHDSNDSLNRSSYILYRKPALATNVTTPFEATTAKFLTLSSYARDGMSGGMSAHGNDFIYTSMGHDNNNGAFWCLHMDDMVNTAWHDEEHYTAFTGIVNGVNYSKSQLKVNIQDKLKPLTERIMGADDAPITFTDSTNAGDIFWTTCTCYGGLSSIESDTNPDIDIDVFSEWSKRMEDDGLSINGSVKGLKCIEVLSKLARITDSSIVMEGSKILVRRWTAIDSIMQTFNNSDGHISLSLSDRSIINNQTMFGGYDTESNSYLINVSVVNSDSQAIYGDKEQIERDTTFWFVSSGACANFSQRKVGFHNEPGEMYSIRTPLISLTRHIGDAIDVNDETTISGSADLTMRIIGKAINLDTMQIDISANPQLAVVGFHLDVDSLDTTSRFLT